MDFFFFDLGFFLHPTGCNFEEEIENLIFLHDFLETLHLLENANHNNNSYYIAMQ